MAFLLILLKKYDIISCKRKMKKEKKEGRKSYQLLKLDLSAGNLIKTMEFMYLPTDASAIGIKQTYLLKSIKRGIVVLKLIAQLVKQCSPIAL